MPTDRKLQKFKGARFREFCKIAWKGARFIIIDKVSKAIEEVDHSIRIQNGQNNPHCRRANCSDQTRITGQKIAKSRNYRNRAETRATAHPQRPATSQKSKCAIYFELDLAGGRVHCRFENLPVRKA